MAPDNDAAHRYGVDHASAADERILINARAAEWERLRNIAIREDSSRTDEQIEARAKELQRAKLSAAGRKGHAMQRERLAQADALLALIPEFRLRLLECIDMIDARVRAGIEAEETAA